MDIEKQLNKNYEKYVVPYKEALEEEKVFSSLQISYVNENGEYRTNNFTLYDYQKESLINLHKYHNNIFKKYRCSGYSTLTALHLYYQLKCDVVNNEENKYLVVCPNNALANEIKKKIFEYANQLKDNLERKELYEKIMNIVFTGGKTALVATRGYRFKEAWFDDATYIEDLSNIITNVKICNLGVKFTIVIDDDDTKNEKDICSILKDDFPIVQEINWWEIPYFAKDLWWYKTKRQRFSYDINGNIFVDREQCNKMIEDGWQPTSQRYDEYKKLKKLDNGPEKIDDYRID